MHFEPQGVYSTGTFCSIFLFLGTGDSVFVVASIRDAVAAHVLPEIAGLSTPDQAWWLCLLLVVQSTVGTVYSGFFTCSAVARRSARTGGDCHHPHALPSAGGGGPAHRASGDGPYDLGGILTLHSVAVW